MKSGIIFDLKEFAVFDGPGMRQTVFFKGCPLRCNWCHNPEGLEIAPNLMVSKASCLHCGACTKICSSKNCIACGKCVPVCPLRLRAIAGERLTSEELANRILINSDYYAAYGGGVTFSGGEPLFQAEFLIETLQRLPKVHKAIETSGYTDFETFKSAAAELDYIMIDLKLFDSELHKAYTGAGNEQILANIKWLCGGGIPFTVRIPVIPGVNDYEENYRKTAEWIAGAPMLQQVELLPYHKTAGAKYELAGKKYQPMFDVNRAVRVSQDIFKEYGIRSSVL